jgi:hypothetical protein
MKGQIFQYSVMGRQTQFNAPFGMVLGVEEIRNGSYGIVDVNNQPIQANHLDVVSTGGSITVSSDNIDIFGLRINISQIQHVVFFPNTTIFGDIMYEPALGLVQSTVFVDTYRTTTWDGTLSAPGFLISGGQFLTVPVGQLPTPVGALFPNWEKQVADTRRYYDRFDPPDDPILTAMARATYGYVPQTYMNELNIDDRIQFNFFRGTLKSKGTMQPYAAFVQGTTVGSCVIAEDWAWKFAKYGDRRKVVVLFAVNQADFVDVYQTIRFASSTYEDDRILYIPSFSPPSSDPRWVVPPPQDLYANLPYKFPITQNGMVDFQKFLYTAAIVDQTAQAPAVTLFHWDPTINLHEPLALSLVDYKTSYDPAFYNQGPLAANGSNSLIWGAFQVGNVWWDITAAIYSPYKSYLPDYLKETREWGKLLYFLGSITRVNDIVTVVTLDPNTGLPIDNNLVNGQTIVISGADQISYNGSIQVTIASSNSFTFSTNQAADSPATGNIIIQVGQINCYEWVASPVPPAAWSSYVSMQKGFDIYTGTVLNVSNASYATQEIWDINGNPTTTYYFWVQANTRIIPTKGLCVNDIAGRLISPANYLVPYFGIIDSETIFIFSGDEVVVDDSAIELTYWWYEMPTHIEWLLIGENDDFNSIPPFITDKLLDSMLRTDIHGNPVPNATLAPCEIYGTCFFPAQSVFQDVTNAINIYTTSINSLLINIDVNSTSSIMSGLLLSDEQTSLNPNGYWIKVTWWLRGIDPIIYDTVVNAAELSFNTTLGLYTVGDVVKEIESTQVDPWTSSQVAAYYQYDGTNWNLVGIDNHAVAINANIVINPTTFRKFFGNLISSITTIQANIILFALLYEMVRQNPLIDWFFKTSYIDIHVTQPIPITPYVSPDQVTIITDAIVNLKPYRTKLRNQIASYDTQDNLLPIIQETQLSKYTLVFDRLACDLTDENAWDTIPWDATGISPEAQSITLPFVGNGLQTCFNIPKVIGLEGIFIFIDGQLVTNYSINIINSELCFDAAPALNAMISLVINGPYEYFGVFDFSFLGNGVIDSQIVANRVSQTYISNIFSVWNGVHQSPIIDFTLVVTSDTNIVYSTTPSSGIEVSGTVFGGISGTIFNEIAYTGDGVTSSFNTHAENQNIDSIIVIINGVWQTPGTDYSISNHVFSYVMFNTAPKINDQIVIYFIVNPNWVISQNLTFIGDGTTSFFAISGIGSNSPTIFANIDGIEQNIDLGDFSITAMGIEFAQAPRSGTNIALFVVFAGIGSALSVGAFPTTIQWDWAFWNYADLGTQEYDFAGFFFGDGITESFTVPIPQISSLLYGTQIQFFQNGIGVSLISLGLSMSETKLLSGITVFLSGPLPVDVYGAIYIARGLVEGLLPSFGYQNPDGVVFTPTPASYQHFFARLISASFDPSTVMAGCDFHTPEERIEQDVDDNFTICVQTYPQPFINYPPPATAPHLLGLSANSAVGTIQLAISSIISLSGLQANSIVPIITSSPYGSGGYGLGSYSGTFIIIS